MRIQYIGLAGVRIVDPYAWEPENAYVVDVDAGTAGDLLSYPRAEFAVSEDEPLLGLPGMTAGRLAELALCGIGDAGALAAAGEKDVPGLARALGVDAKQVRDWIKEAKSINRDYPVLQTQQAPHGGEEDD